MTTQEWSSAINLQRLLFLYEDVASARKFRLAALACCRRIGPLLDPRHLADAVRVAELHTQGRATERDLLASARILRRYRGRARNSGRPWSSARWHAFHAVRALVHVDSQFPARPCYQAIDAAKDALRAVVDTQFPPSDGGKRSPDAFPMMVAEQTVLCELIRDIMGHPYRLPAIRPTWRTRRVLEVAGRIDDEGDFGALPGLADALEEAGCDAADLLGHCRWGRRHARGCWAVDAILGKA